MYFEKSSWGGVEPTNRSEPTANQKKKLACRGNDEKDRGTRSGRGREVKGGVCGMEKRRSPRIKKEITADRAQGKGKPQPWIKKKKLCWEKRYSVVVSFRKFGKKKKKRSTKPRG